MVGSGLAIAYGLGCPPVGAEHMLRLHGLQPWFNLSDTAVEEALGQGVGFRLAYQLYPDDSSLVPITKYAIVETDRDGRPVQLLGVAQNVTREVDLWSILG